MYKNFKFPIQRKGQFPGSQKHAIFRKIDGCAAADGVIAVKLYSYTCRDSIIGSFFHTAADLSVEGYIQGLITCDESGDKFQILFGWIHQFNSYAVVITI